jgi:hypothetical protein
VVASPKSRDELLKAPIGELGGCWLGYVCGGCTKSGYVPLKLLSGKHGSRHQLHAIIARMRCSDCGARPGPVWLVDHPIENSTHGGQVATWRVDLAP